MKHDELVQRIGKEARRHDLEWGIVRQGGNHEIWRCGTTTVPIPRHDEIGEQLARWIFRELEGQLGKDWWR